jgi:hypothetical protein
VANLNSISLADPAYADTAWGTRSMDSKYRPIFCPLALSQAAVTPPSTISPAPLM